jgi:hypothetical protein
MNGTEENLVIVMTADRAPYMTATLVAKADPAEVTRYMGQPGHYTTLFSLAGAKPNGGEWLKKFKAFNLNRYSSRKPYLQLEGLETLLRTWWIGVAPETIEENIQQINQLMGTLKEDALRATNLAAQQPRGIPPRDDGDDPADPAEVPPNGS